MVTSMKINGIINNSSSLSGNITAHSPCTNGTINSENEITGNINNEHIKELFFLNSGEFPAVGNENSLYIAASDNAVYRFDSEKLIYVCIGNDSSQIEIIQGCL